METKATRVDTHAPGQKVAPHGRKQGNDHRQRARRPEPLGGRAAARERGGQAERQPCERRRYQPAADEALRTFREH
jgi:hypothetical protein